MTAITRRNALVGAGAVVAVAGVPLGAQADDVELIALGRQWRESYAEWLQCHCDEENTVLLKQAHAIEDRIAEIPACSHDGALVKLRVAAEHLRLMGEIKADCYSLLTYQAWQALEGEAATADFERLVREAQS